jgi:ABC-type glutathione transport system ATPase component
MPKSSSAPEVEHDRSESDWYRARSCGQAHPDRAAVVIQLEHVGKIYSPGTPAEVKALHDINLNIDRGEFLAIMGPSGSGKSTLMNLIGCLDLPTSGRCLIDGVDVAGLDAAGRARLRLQKLGFVFQGFHLLTRMTALENVMLPLVYAGVARAERRRLGEAALRDVGPGTDQSPTDPFGRRTDRRARHQDWPRHPGAVQAPAIGRTHHHPDHSRSAGG